MIGFIFWLIIILSLVAILICLTFDTEFLSIQKSSEYIAASLFILVNLLFVNVADNDAFDITSVVFDFLLHDVEGFFEELVIGGSVCDFSLIWLRTAFFFESFFTSFFSGFFHLDIFSVSLIWLTSLLLYICVSLNWTSWFYKRDYFLSFYFVSLFFIFLLLFWAFCVSNIFWFYLFFEASLAPLVFLIGAYGSRHGAKLQAAYKLYFFTLLASFPLLLVIVLLALSFGGLQYSLFRSFVFLEPFSENLCWWVFFLAFAVKLPVVPLHLWLPEAHVEAPTGGSILLAGILLKLGAYGFVRFLIPFFPESTDANTPFVLTIALITAVVSSLVSMVQLDLKRVIAYSSVSHMSFVLFGLFSDDYVGFIGALNLLFSHGLVSSALFLVLGFFYDRFKTRIIFYSQSLSSFAPILSFFTFLVSFSNIALPGNYSFLSELFVLVSASYSIIYLLGGFLTFFASVYTLRPVLSVLFGPINGGQVAYSDLDEREFSLILLLITGVVLFGIFPELINILFKDFVF